MARTRLKARDYYSVVLKDVAASYGRRRHDQAIEFMSGRLDVVTSETVTGVWASTRTSDPSGRR